MPTINQSMAVQVEHLQSVQGRGGFMVHPPPAESPNQTRSPLLDSSLPVLVSGADVYQRQFYRNHGGLPQRRFFPVRIA